MRARKPNDVSAYERDLAMITIGGPQPLQGPIEISRYNPDWPAWYAAEEARIRSILGDRALRIEHVGSTAVTGLPAKPLIDIVMEVRDTAAEPEYLPDLEAAGYILRLREPEWYEHRLLKGPDRDINVHVFPAGCMEVERMLLFRDWLRANADDRELYARVKRELSACDWRYMQQYADSKAAVVGEIMARATSAGSPPA